MQTTHTIRRHVAAAALATLLAACGHTAGRENAGEFIDDSTMTTSVKAAIFHNPSLNTAQINVDTFRRVVQLSGYVDTHETRAEAGDVAGRIDGVRSVRNDLIVR